MTKKNLIFTLLFMLSINISYAQNTRIVEVENDDLSLFLKFIEVEIFVLKIDGEIIPQSQYTHH